VKFGNVLYKPNNSTDGKTVLGTQKLIVQKLMVVKENVNGVMVS
jgi:hypothetical protein